MCFISYHTHKCLPIVVPDLLSYYKVNVQTGFKLPVWANGIWWHCAFWMSPLDTNSHSLSAVVLPDLSFFFCTTSLDSNYSGRSFDSDIRNPSCDLSFIFFVQTNATSNWCVCLCVLCMEFCFGTDVRTAERLLGFVVAERITGRFILCWESRYFCVMSLKIIASRNLAMRTIHSCVSQFDKTQQVNY